MPCKHVVPSARAMLMYFTLLCLMTSRSLVKATSANGRKLPQTNPLTVLDEGRDGASEPAAQHRGSGERVAPSSQGLVLTPESGEPYKVTEKQYLRDDWCKTLPLRQIINAEGCIGRTITNRFCYGQCNSFYIPKQSLDYNDAFRSCTFCKPVRTTTFTVTLRCPGRTPNTVRKRVEKIKQCRCVAVNV